MDTAPQHLRVILRVKRKRDEVVPAMLLVEEGHQSQKRRLMAGLLDAFQDLSATQEETSFAPKNKRKKDLDQDSTPRLLFKKVDNKGELKEPNVVCSNDSNSAERDLSTDGVITGTSFHIIDLEHDESTHQILPVLPFYRDAPDLPPLPPPPPPPPLAAAGAGAGGAAAGAQRILGPGERAADEAIVRAFREGGAAVDELPEALRAAGVGAGFQRPLADRTTALMAAAYHGRAAAVGALLAAGADPRPRDVHGQDAAGLAAARGHAGVHARLLRAAGAARRRPGPRPRQRPAAGGAALGAAAAAQGGAPLPPRDIDHSVGSDQSLKISHNFVGRSSGGSATSKVDDLGSRMATDVPEDPGFVYDWYHLDLDAPMSSGDGAKPSSLETQASCPVIQLNGFTQNEDGQLVFIDEFGEEEMEKSDEGDDTDSNDEDHPHNDYPDEGVFSSDDGGTYSEDDDYGEGLGSSGIWKAIPSGRLEQEEAEIYNSDYGNEAVDFSNTNQATETGGHDFSSLLDNNYNIRSNSNSNSNSTNDAHHNYNIFLSDDHAHMMHDQYRGFSNGDDGGNSDGGSHNDESDY